MPAPVGAGILPRSLAAVALILAPADSQGPFEANHRHGGARRARSAKGPRRL